MTDEPADEPAPQPSRLERLVLRKAMVNVPLTAGMAVMAFAGVFLIPPAPGHPPPFAVLTTSLAVLAVVAGLALAVLGLIVELLVIAPMRSYRTRRLAGKPHRHRAQR